MTYVVIDVDGALHIHAQTATAETIRDEVGDWDMVRLGLPMMAWVNDVGFLDGLPRNVVGSVLLMCCKAARQPYAGPVVVTGWDEYTEITPLGGEWLTSVQELHQCIVDALAGDDRCTRCHPAWRETVRAAAEMVRTAPTPQLQIISLDDWAGA